LLSPGEYLALTSNVVILQNEYTSSVNGNLLEVKTLPSFNDDEGAVELIDATGKLIDRFQYSEEMHSVFLKNEEGVSLERISASLSSEANWKSASSTVGFATPGYANSNYIEPSEGLSEVVIEPEIFNPLAGQQSFALIHYNFEHTGNVGTVRIFDALGRSVKEIANNDILGAKGFYRWDGDRDDGSKAALGYYVVCFEVFNSDGAVNRYLRRIAVACYFD
jgi:hypothetical protein